MAISRAGLTPGTPRTLCFYASLTLTVMGTPDRTIRLVCLPPLGVAASLNSCIESMMGAGHHAWFRNIIAVGLDAAEGEFYDIIDSADGLDLTFAIDCVVW
jgi:hypothetical protein